MLYCKPLFFRNAEHKKANFYLYKRRALGWIRVAKLHDKNTTANEGYL